MGAAIYAARNQCTGHREEKTITRVRGVHGDMDGVTQAQLAIVATILEPSITVQSSLPDRYQLYWQLSDGEVLGKEEAKAINQGLVKYGADPAAVDVSRLLRLRVVEDALDLINLAVSKLPLNIKQGIQ